MNVRLQYTSSFVAGIYYNDSLRMNNYTVSLWMLTNSADAIEQDISFERIKYFIDNAMDSTVFVNSADHDECQRLTQAGFDITTLPGEPVDQLIGIMLYYKLNAIAEQRMVVLETEVSSQLGSGVVYLHGENENLNNITQPDWWSTADTDHCDKTLLHNDKVLPMNCGTLWRDLELAWPDLGNSVSDDNTLVFTDFGKNETK